MIIKRYILSKIAFIILLFLFIPGASCGEAAKTSNKKKETQAPPFQGKAISLKVLQNRLLECQKKPPCSNDILKLADIKRITGYIVDEANHDLILIGQVDDSLPSIYIEDFIIALRNTWLKYTERRGNIHYYSDPGCSIDPDEKIIEKLDILGQQILNCTSSEQVEKGIKDWHSICQSPQTVRVFGIPFDTRFAWVMVKADYDMKRIVDGHDSLNIPGFSSLTDMTLDKAKSDITQGRPISIPISSMNRFWFYPGENRYIEDKGVVIIERSQVILLTEEQFRSRKGGIVGKGSPNPLAQRFVESFTAQYFEVAKQRPIYTELENLFRFVALAKIMKSKSPHNEAKLDLGYLLENFKIQKTSVSRQVPGRSHAKRFEHRRDIPAGYQIAQLWLPSCGGVGINMNVSQSNFSKDSTGRLSTLKATVLKARPSSDALFWDFPLMWRVRFEQGDIPSTYLARR